MAIAMTYSRVSFGSCSQLVVVEVHISTGLPKFSIVGLPETAVKESKDRVRSAIMNSNFEFPTRRLTVNLAPANLPKDGGRFDLAIAICILGASSQISKEILLQYEFIGELALNGDLRGVDGILAFVAAAKNSGRATIIPQENVADVNFPSLKNIFPANSLLDICMHLNGIKKISELNSFSVEEEQSSTLDLIDVYGHEHAKRALTIAVAGGHNILFVGPPGTGKTMIATRAVGLLPKMTEEEAIETSIIYSMSNVGGKKRISWERPFRNPHHTSSSVAIIGGACPPKPGEISLAHNGVLLLDEISEFNRCVIDALREPIETGVVAIARATAHLEFNAKFQLILTMNPCPCGYYMDNENVCRCTKEQIKRYTGKISGPILDRIDIQVLVPRAAKGMLLSKKKGAKSQDLRQTVKFAYQNQIDRQGKLNARLTVKEIDMFCKIEDPLISVVERLASEMNMSSRAYHMVLKIARTIADLEGNETILDKHIREAFLHRRSKLFE